MLTARAALLIFYVGFLALFRGITEIVLAFELKLASDRLSAGVPVQRTPTHAES